MTTTPKKAARAADKEACDDSTKASPGMPSTPTIPPTTATIGAATRKVLQRNRISSSPGFIAALDQSGGSTPRALGKYGITDIRGDKDDMYRLIHDMRTRIVTSDAFTGDRIIGAILFEDTVFHRRVHGRPAATYLWEEKNIVPFLKVDHGILDEKDGVQLMRPIPGLSELLRKCGCDATPAHRMAGPGPGDCIFGTKARSVIRHGKR